MDFGWTFFCIRDYGLWFARYGSNEIPHGSESGTLPAIARILLYRDFIGRTEGKSFVIVAMLRSILAPYLAVTIEQNGNIPHKFAKIERELMRLAIRRHRVIRPSQAARELELHKQTVIKYCRLLVEKGKFRAVPSGGSGRIRQYEYLGSTLSSDLI
ncbi:hypothetical protein [Paenibacillus sp. CECT 9249]|uniref:hypothetical protein n=1 Tax=Paenibacillus sp. CECT 9249 TaxID=2845385 RepID=UPI001E286A9E|nr:hypothetical protein [Paenibacillus sp. CECT 9249]